MFTLILLTLLLGIIWGILLLTIFLLWKVKVKCPQCKQLRPLKEVLLFNWKSKQITGQACLKCQQVKPQVEIF